MWVDEAMREVAAEAVFPGHTHVFLMDEGELKRRMNAVTNAFADATDEVDFFHAFAVKANPLRAVLEVAKSCGFGAETASIGEFRMAEMVYPTPPDGAAPGGPIIFDSPAKTLEELHYALQRHCYLNVDNFTELQRIVDLVDGSIPGFAKVDAFRAVVGIRVNPQSVVSTTNTALATGGKVSKFGVALHDPGNKERLIHSYATLHDKVNLRMVHVHSGSQGLSVDTMVAGVRAIVEELVNHPQLAGIISVVDIGGGFPVDFSTDVETVTVRNYVAALCRDVPALFHPVAAAVAAGGGGGGEATASPRKRTVITEFGRAIAAKSGVLISRVEYTKMSGGRQILLQHVGADLAVRTVWQPERWPLRVCVYNAAGVSRCAAPRTGYTGDQLAEASEGGVCVPAGTVLTDVAGPCCNSGCTLTRAVPLPADIEPLRDLLVVYDVGGYYHSSFSTYNMRQMPACYMRYETAGDGGKLVCVKPAQPVEETISLFA